MPKPWEVTYEDAGAVVPPWQRKYGEEEPEVAPLSDWDRLLKGVLDPIEGGAQLLEQSAPPIVRDVVNTANNALAEYGIVAPVGEKGLSGDIAQREKDYQARLAATPGFEDGGFDLARIAGGAVSPANLALAYAAPQSFFGRVGMGGVMGLTQPSSEVDDEKFWDEKAAQGGLGLVAGVAGEGIARGAARAVSPWASRNKEIQLLRSEGVSPSLGQLLGPRASRIEQGLSSAPLLGSGIKEARNRAFEDFNRAVANRALKPIGESVPKTTKPGFELVDDVFTRIGHKYDNLLPNLKGQLDPQLQSEIASLRAMAQSLPDAQRLQFDRILKHELEDRFTSAGLASGETIKNIESKLGQLAKGYMRDPDYDKRTLGNAIRETQASLRDMLERVNPSHQGELQKINKAWSELLRLEKSAVKAKKNEGIFTPGQFTDSVAQLDPTRGSRLTARGRAQGQDLARAGQKVLGNTVPDSGTPFRTALGLGMLGGGYAIHPGIFAMELAGLLPYTKGGQSFANFALANRPAGAEALAGGLRKAAPYLMPGTNAALQDTLR